MEENKVEGKIELIAPTKVENKNEKKVDVISSKELDFSDIFVTEKDTFDVNVKFYKKDDILMVSSVDDAFDEKQISKEFSVSFKYPDHGDSTRIIGQTSKLSVSTENIDMRELVALEFSRLLCLIRKWSLDKELNNKNILSMHPKIIKSLVVGLRNKIGMDGIF